MNYNIVTFTKIAQFIVQSNKAVMIHLLPAEEDKRKIEVLHKHLKSNLRYYVRTQDTKFIPYMTLFYYKDTIKQLPNLNQESFKKWKFKIESPPTVRTDKIELRKLKDGEVVANFGISTYFTNEGRSLRVQAGLTYKASRLAAYHNTWALNKLYTFQNAIY